MFIDDIEDLWGEQSKIKGRRARKPKDVACCLRLLLDATKVHFAAGEVQREPAEHCAGPAKGVFSYYIPVYFLLRNAKEKSIFFLCRLSFNFYVPGKLLVLGKKQALSHRTTVE